MRLIQSPAQFSNPSQERKHLERGIMLRVPVECKTFNYMPRIENLDSEPEMANKVLLLLLLRVFIEL